MVEDGDVLSWDVIKVHEISFFVRHMGEGSGVRLGVVLSLLSGDLKFVLVMVEVVGVM